MLLDNNCAATVTTMFTCTAIVNVGSLITLLGGEICDMNESLSFNGAVQISNVHVSNDDINISCLSPGGLITAQAIDNGTPVGSPVTGVTAITCM